MRPQAHYGRRRDFWATLVVLVFSMATLTRPPPSSIAPGQGSPAIEFTLTQVYGRDSSSIREASLSPDGRWIAFTREDGTTRRNIWILSTEGGEPVPLTTGRYFDDAAVWFPAGDRIAFRSTRTPIPAIMTVPFDTLTGRPTGPPRQVTLDQIYEHFDVSPDGRRIAYTASNGRGRILLRILPAVGGTARTLADGVLEPIWSPDGASIYAVIGDGRSPKRTLKRIFPDEGRVEEIFAWPGRIRIMWRGPNRSFVLRETPKPMEWEVANLSGHPVGRIDFPRGMNPMGISREGDRILCVRPTWSFPLMILPIEGGAARRLDVGHRYGEPLGWSPDGKRVLFETDLNGRAGLLYATVAGGPMPQVKLPEERLTDFTPVLSGDGNHLLYAVDEGGDGITVLKVYSIEDDRSWELSRSHTFVRGAQVEEVPTGAGGTIRRDGQDFLYFERHGVRDELYASPPRGPSRLLRTFLGKPPHSVAVNGERIAWVENSQSEAVLFLATAGEAGARRILIRQGMLDMPVWSPDGDKIACYHFDPSLSSRSDWDPAGRDLVVLELDPSGGIAGKPQAYSIPAGHWWSPRWHPDGRKILVVGIDGNIWLIPLERGARPVAITQDEPNGVWTFHLSPDGRSIAYPVSIQRGSSIWFLELEEPLANRF